MSGVGMSLGMGGGIEESGPGSAAVPDTMPTPASAAVSGLTRASDLDTFKTSIVSDLTEVQRQHLVRVALAPGQDLKLVPAATQQANDTWAGIGSKIEQVFEQLKVIETARDAVPIPDTDSAKARELSAELKRQAHSGDSLRTLLAPELALLPERVQAGVVAVADKIAEHAAALVQTFEARALPWVQALEAAEADALKQARIEERRPYLSHLRDECLALYYSQIEFADIVSYGSGIQERISNALDPDNGEVDLHEVKAMIEDTAAADESVLSPDAKKLAREIGFALVLESVKVDQGLLRGSFAESYLHGKLVDAGEDRSARQALRLNHAETRFLEAVKEYNIEHEGAPIPEALSQRALREFLKTFDAVTGEASAEKVERLRGFLRPDSKLTNAHSRSEVPLEQREFLTRQLEAFTAPMPVVPSYDDVAALLETVGPAPSLGEEIVVIETHPVPIEEVLAAPETSPVIGSSALGGGRSIDWNLNDSAAGAVQFVDSLTGHRAIFTFEGKSREEAMPILTEIELLKAQLEAGLAKGSSREALVTSLAENLSSLATDTKLDYGDFYSRSDLYTAKGKSGGLTVVGHSLPMTPADLLLHESRLVFKAEKCERVSSWNTVTLERSSEGVYITLEGTGSLKPARKGFAPEAAATTSMRFQIADARSTAADVDASLAKIFSGLDKSKLERPRLMSGQAMVLGSGELLERVIKEGQLLAADPAVISHARWAEVRLAQGATIQGLTLINCEVKFSADPAHATSVAFKNVQTIGNGAVELEGLAGARFTNVESTGGVRWNGNLDGSRFEGCFFEGGSGNNLSLSQITWTRGESKRPFNMPPRQAKVSAVR